MNANDRRILDAADFVRRAWAVFDEAAQRRATATAVAHDMVQNAIVAERAEKRAARADVAAGIGRLVADGLTVQQMTELCGVPAADIWRITSATGSEQRRRRPTASHPEGWFHRAATRSQSTHAGYP